MDAFDSQRSSLVYEDDLLESNPFADTPSRSTELRKSVVNNIPDNDGETRVEEETPQPTTTTIAAEQEPISEEAHVEEAEDDIHQGELAQSPIEIVNQQIEELHLEQPEVETASQVRHLNTILGLFITHTQVQV